VFSVSDDPSVIEDDDAIGVSNGSDALCDDQFCGSCGSFFESGAQSASVPVCECGE
jgi:hypothetical protein